MNKNRYYHLVYTTNISYMRVSCQTKSNHIMSFLSISCQTYTSYVNISYIYISNIYISNIYIYMSKIYTIFKTDID